jgi:DinB superfamily
VRPAQWIQVLVIDFSPLRRREVSLQDLAKGLTTGDLAKLTEEMCGRQLELIADAEDADVVFVPDDPEANDTFAARPEDVGLSWTLGHVVVHAAASSEESAALALVLARGLPVEGRSRYEVPWEQATTVEFLRHRIQESLRMRVSMLNAWPDSPHLDNFYAPYEGRPPMNAFGRFLGGLAHDDSHLDQIRKIVYQGKERRSMLPNQ